NRRGLGSVVIVVPLYHLVPLENVDRKKKIPLWPQAGVSPLDSAVMKWLRRLPEVPVTSTLVVANLAIYVWMMRASGMKAGFDYATMTYFGANIVGTGQDASHWRWVTAAFVHRHPIHLAITVWVLAQIGATVERTLGSGVAAAGYVLAGAVGNALSSAIN